MSAPTPEQIDPKLAELHDVLYEMLCTLDSYCKKHEINYFLVAGTLLGAARHKKFIPWDDDVDIGMIRSDYELFINTFKSHPIPGYFLQHHTTDKKYAHIHTKLRKNGTLFEEPNQDPESHHGIFLDIFPFDGTHKSRTKSRIQIAFLTILNKLITSRRDFVRTTKLRRAAAFFIYTITKHIPLEAILSATDKTLKLPKNNDTYCSYHLYGITSHQKARIHNSELFELKALQINEKMFPAPSEWKEILKRCYGDYMTPPPEQERKPKHAIRFKCKTP